MESLIGPGTLSEIGEQPCDWIQVARGTPAGMMPSASAWLDDGKKGTKKKAKQGSLTPYINWVMDVTQIPPGRTKDPSVSLLMLHGQLILNASPISIGRRSIHLGQRRERDMGGDVPPFAFFLHLFNVHFSQVFSCCS